MTELLALLKSTNAGDVAVASWTAARWSAVEDVAARHSLSPLLYSRLLAAGIPAPGATLARLRTHSLHTAVANVRRFHELARVLALLDDAGIAAAVLKGAYLAPVVYQDEALRPMADVDLLVPESEAERALNVLQHGGYAYLSGSEWMGETYGHHALRHQVGGGMLELHARLEPFGHGDAIDHYALWQRMIAVTISGRLTRALAPVDQVVHLCIHAASHHLMEMGLLPLFDLALLFQALGPGIDERTLATRAEEWGARNATYLCLRLARELAAAPVPDSLLERLEAAVLPPDLYASARALTISRAALTQAPSANIVSLWTATDWRVRLRILVNVVRPSHAHMRALYRLGAEEPVRGVLYIRRLLDLLMRRGASLRNLVGHQPEADPYAGLVRWLAEA